MHTYKYNNKHLDTSSNTPRELTCVVYLNPNWVPSHGGEMRVYPFPHEAVDVPPVFDRMILFCSHQMMHRVCVSHAERYVFSLWFGGDINNKTVFPTRPLLSAGEAEGKGENMFPCPYPCLCAW